jgi:hypothetical protein
MTTADDTIAETKARALALACPFCGAQAGEPCRTRNSGREHDWPHSRRIALASTDVRVARTSQALCCSADSSAPSSNAETIAAGGATPIGNETSATSTASHAAASPRTQPSAQTATTRPAITSLLGGCRRAAVGARRNPPHPPQRTPTQPEPESLLLDD